MTQPPSSLPTRSHAANDGPHDGLVTPIGLAAAGLGALAALAALGSAWWVEQASRQAERAHHAPHQLLYIGGTRLHYQLVGDGPPVLLLHGNLLHGADWEATGLVRQLAQRHTVLVIDRPGFGHSDRPRTRFWTPAEQARLLLHAAEVLGVERPVVVGHSLGAQVALCMALQRPADVAGLVLVNGYYWPDLRVDRWLAAPLALPVLGDVLRYTTAAWTARVALGAAMRRAFSPQPVPPDFWDAVPRELVLRPLQHRATAEDGARMVAQARALQQRYRELQVPVTVIAGTGDRVVPFSQSLRLHAQVAGARLNLIDGMGHMAHHGAAEQILAGVQHALAAGNTTAPTAPAAPTA